MNLRDLGYRTVDLVFAGCLATTLLAVAVMQGSIPDAGGLMAHVALVLVAYLAGLRFMARFGRPERWRMVFRVAGMLLGIPYVAVDLWRHLPGGV